MSPEQVSGKKLDQRSDIYSFGITCYHMFAGVPPFQGENAVSVAVKHLHETAQPMVEVRPDLPVPVCQLIEKMIAKQPEDRYPDAQAIVNDVRKLAKAVRTGEPVEDLTADGNAASVQFPTRRPALVLTLLCLLVLVLGAGMGWQLRTRVPAPNPDSLGSVPRLASAQQQYLHAMFQIDDEDAFKAVIAWFPSQEDKLWRRRAEEQLALLYLKDRRRVDDARKQLDRLKIGIEATDRQLIAEARIGEAYLEALNKNKDAARKILQRDAEEFNRYLSGSWRQLAQEVRQLVAEDPGRPPPRAP
jgi:serine/threonine-protein kinase